MATDERNWYDRGQTAFAHSRHVTQPIVQHYPTQDIYTLADEAEYLRGWFDAEISSQLTLSLD